MSVIKEKTKSKSLGKRKILIKIGVSALSGLIFAGFAIGAFVYILHEMEEKFPSDKQEMIIIGSEDESQDEQDATTQIPTTDSEDSTEESEDTTDESEGGEEQDAEEMIQPPLVDIQQWQYNLYSKGNEMMPAVVSINAGSSCGIVLSIQGETITILVSVGQNTDAVKVTFFDGTLVSGTVSGYDSSTGIAMVSVKKELLTQETLNQIKTIELGSSNSLRQGQYVIAIGKPLGEERTIVTGVITETRDVISYLDREHKVFNTDILSVGRTDGFILGQNGALIGVITHQTDKDGAYNTVSAFGVSSVTKIMELLANGKTIPYIGFEGVTVTDEIKDKHGIPDGVYVNRVETDSPAMLGNLQAGDVITNVDGVKVYSMEGLQQLFLGKNQGETVTITISRQVNGKYKKVVLEVIIGKERIESRGIE